MKIEIGRTGNDKFKITDSLGKDITHEIPCRSITIECEANNYTTAIIESFIDSVDVTPMEVKYNVGHYTDVIGIVLRGGKIICFPKNK